MTNAERQAQAEIGSLVAMVAQVGTAGNMGEREGAQITMAEGKLVVEGRGDWHAPGREGAKPSEFMILLCTGGPAVPIRGELDRHSEPEKSRIEYQDLFTPW